MDPMLLVTIGFVAFYLIFAMRTQKKAQQARTDMMNQLGVGSHIVTIGGLHGVVAELTDDIVVLDCEGIYLTFERKAIARVESGPVSQIANSETVEESVEEDEVVETESVE